MSENGNLDELYQNIVLLKLHSDQKWDSLGGGLVSQLAPIEFDELNSSIEKSDSKSFLFLAEEKYISSAISKIKDIQATFPHLTWIAIDIDLQEQTLSQLLSELELFAILNHESGLNKFLSRAVENQKFKSDYFETLERVRSQNKKLEGMNQNLEKIVHERTLKEFAASQQTSRSLKAIQNILTFVKSMSRITHIEEFMSQVRTEYKKVKGLLPPMLVLENDFMETRFFYFQGKQLIEKKMDRHPHEALFLAGGTNEARSFLSNFLGRPMGPLFIQDMKFQATELKNIGAHLIFERNLANQDEENFSRFSEERWSIITMALENILIKEGMQNIARQWSRTFNDMKDPIVILDSNYNMTLSNKSFHGENPLSNHKNLSRPEPGHQESPMQVTFKTGEPHQGDIHIDNKVYRVHSYPIRLDKEEKVSHVINQYVDVTQSIDLQTRVIQGEKMAAVGLLAGNIAHELNNPLTGISSLSELLMEDFKKDSNTYKDMAEIKMAAERCQRIIKDLLEFSNLNTDSKEKLVDANEIVTKTLPLLKMALRTMNSGIDLADESAWVEINPQLLQQVIFNLINNACQAMDEGGQLTVISEVAADQVTIRIQDTGPGIPEEIRAAVFDPFFTTKSKGKGTGLGLSMSKSIIERAQGRLELNPDYEGGTEFRVILPKARP